MADHESLMTNRRWIFYCVPSQQKAPVDKRVTALHQRHGFIGFEFPGSGLSFRGSVLPQPLKCKPFIEPTLEIFVEKLPGLPV